MCNGGHCAGHNIKHENEYENQRITEIESDEGLGHSGSSDEETMKMKTENVENPETGEGKKEDLYQCRYCDRTFCYLCHLKVHERVHTGEKPYKCTFCDCTFSQLGSLTVHMRIHTGEKPYECRICLKKFRHINSLRRHQRQVHRKTPAEVDAAPRGGMDSQPAYAPASQLAPARAAAHPFHPYAAARPMTMARNPMKSALEMRSPSVAPLGYAAAFNPAYALHMQQMQHARQMQNLANQQAVMNQMMTQQHKQLIGQPAQPMATQPTVRAPTNHSISAMINEKPTPNKNKKHSFSISALVGDASETESVHESESDSAHVEEVVDVVSDESSHVDVSGKQSPSHSDSADSGHNSSTVSGSLIDDDLRRALTIDPSTLTIDEKQRLRRKLAEIALRNISSDSGVCGEVC